MTAREASESSRRLTGRSLSIQTVRRLCREGRLEHRRMTTTREIVVSDKAMRDCAKREGWME